LGHRMMSLWEMKSLFAHRFLSGTARPATLS
jgi:hypothetical protein